MRKTQHWTHGVNISVEIIGHSLTIEQDNFFSSTSWFLQLVEEHWWTTEVNLLSNALIKPSKLTYKEKLEKFPQLTSSIFF